MYHDSNRRINSRIKFKLIKNIYINETSKIYIAQHYQINQKKKIA